MTHNILDFLRGLLVQYGYWAVAATLLLENAGIPVPGETVLLLASFLAFSEHALDLRWIIVVGTIAATLGDNLGFALGHYGGRPLLERYQRFFRVQPATLERGEQIFARYGSVTVFFARFVFGMRIIAGPLAGVLLMPWRRFVLFNFLGAVTWVTVIAVLGYVFGSQWERLVKYLGRANAILGVAAALLIYYAIRRYRQRREAREEAG